MTHTTASPTRLASNFVIAELALFLFIFLQLLTGLVEATYTFGLLSVDVPPETVFVLFLLTPLLLLLYPRILDGRAGRIFTLAAYTVASICWGVSLVTDTRGKMLLCGIGTGAALLALAGLLRRSRADAPLPFGEALAAAALATTALRTSTFFDWIDGRAESVFNVFFAVTPFLLISVIGIARWLFHAPAEETIPAGNAPARMGFGRAAALCLGLFGVITLVYFAFATPAVIARWTGAAYGPVIIVSSAVVALLLFAWPQLNRLGRIFEPRLLLGWNVLFVLALALALGLHSVRFPATADGFPFDQPDPGLVGQIALYAMLLLHPVIYLDFGLLGRTLSEGAPSVEGAPSNGAPSARTLAGAFSLGAGALALLLFAHIFTSVYDYIPVIGPWFRDRFTLVNTVPALLAALAMFVLLRGRYVPLQAPRRWGPLFYLFLAFLVAAMVSGLWWELLPPAQGRRALRVLTYNIQQGYGADGQKNYHGLYRVMFRQGAEIIGLQESDTARIAGGNSDVVRYLAQRMGMYSYYGPRTTSGTFGIALLSRYPIEDARTFYLYSKGEQTAAIQARIRVGEKSFTVLVTHLGNDGPLIQQQQVLQRLAGQENIIAMGDFNFRPDTAQYRQTTQTLLDGWEAAQNKTAQEGDDPTRRIDHIFLSPGTRVTQAEYLPEGPSDHPAMLLEISWE